MELHDKVVIVTGASKGIGRSIAQEMAREGARVIINYNMDKAGAQATATEIKKRYKRETLIVQADVSKKVAVRRMIKYTQRKFGRIDILVNNAGVMTEKYLFRMTDEEWHRCMAINLNGVYFCARACLLPMLRQQSGRIINIVSISGLFANPGHTAYGASKAAVISFTKTLSKEVARKGITINAVAPGYINTAMSQDFAQRNKSLLKKIIPAGRLGKPEEIARLVVFLASDKASYISGQVISADGGLLL